MDAGIPWPMTQFSVKPPPGSPPERPPTHIVTVGKSAVIVVWIAFFTFVLSTLLIAFLASRVQVKHRALHYITLVITGVTSLCYFATVTGSGVWLIWAGFTESGSLVLRPFFWARHAGWAITFPLILLDLALLAGLPWVDVVLIVLAGDAAVACTAWSAVSYIVPFARWGWYVFSLIFLGLVLFTLVLKGRKSAKRQHAAITRLYTILMLYTVSIGTLHAIVLALDNITGIIDLNTEVIVETILDILAKAVFGILLLVVHRHDSDDVGPAKFSKVWLETRGTRGGIHLPGSDS